MPIQKLHTNRIFIFMPDFCCSTCFAINTISYTKYLFFHYGIAFYCTNTSKFVYCHIYWHTLVLFPVWATINQVIIKLFVQVFVYTVFQFSCLKLGCIIADRRICLTLNGNCLVVYKAIILFYTTTNDVWQSKLLYLLSKFDVVSLFNFSFSSDISQWLNFQQPNIEQCWIPFRVLNGHSTILFCKGSVQILSPFCNWNLSFLLLC